MVPCLELMASAGERPPMAQEGARTEFWLDSKLALPVLTQPWLCLRTWEAGLAAGLLALQCGPIAVL